MLLFYIRHGDPVYDPDSLTPLGARQAEALAKRLARHGLDRIYASSSNRAMLTAMATQLPIRNFVAMSAGVFSPRMARGLLKVLNDNQSTPAGFLMILSGVIPALFRLPGLFKEI